MKLFKIDSKGKTRVWWAEILEDYEKAIIKISSGINEGSIVETFIEIKDGKNIGKINETNFLEQAKLEVKSRYEKQKKQGYVESLSNASNKLGSGINKPMLAIKFDPTKKQKGSKDLKDLKIENKLVYTQYKYDGFRCKSYISNNIDLFTRSGDKMLEFPHIEKEINQLKKEFKHDLNLDGELYTNEYSFNKLSSLLRKEKKKDIDWEELAKVKYYVYDTDINVGYCKRYDFLCEIFKNFQSDNIILVNSNKILATNDNLLSELENALELEYEGLIIRTLDTPYEHKRSKSLIKYKIFEDAEFKILDIEYDKIGNLGKFIIQLDIPVVDSDGKTLTTFKAGTSNISHEEGRKIILEKEYYIGKMATIEFFGRDPRPRFPKFKGIRTDI